MAEEQNNQANGAAQNEQQANAQFSIQRIYVKRRFF